MSRYGLYFLLVRHLPSDAGNSFAVSVHAILHTLIGRLLHTAKYRIVVNSNSRV